MTLAHFYDHTYYRDGERTYSSGAFSQASWERYLRHFDRLTVVANLGPAGTKTNGLNPVDHPSVDFAFVPNARGLVNYLKYNAGFTEQLKDIIRRHDAVAVRLPSEIGLVVIELARQLGKPWAVELVGCCWDGYRNHGTLKGKLLAPITFPRTKRAVAASPHVISVTEHWLQARYPSEGHRAHASNVMVEVDGTGEVLRRRLEKIEMLSESNVVHIGLIASVDVRLKGHAELVRALAGLPAAMRNRYRVHFVGPGKGEWLKAAIAEAGLPAEHFTFHGKVPSGAPVLERLDGLDLYVHPSKKEGLPRVVIEAMSRGLPVLASAAAGTPELVPEEYLHAPGDWERLREQLENFLTEDRAVTAASARRNFAVAKRYTAAELKVRRDQFWGEFAATVAKPTLTC